MNFYSAFLSDIEPRSKYARNKTTNPPNFERGNAAKIAGKNLPKYKQIMASHCEGGFASELTEKIVLLKRSFSTLLPKPQRII